MRSIVSIILIQHSERIHPHAYVKLFKRSVNCITGHCLSFVGACVIPVFNDDCQTTDYRHLVANDGHSIIGHNEPKSFHNNLSLLTSTPSDPLLKELILKCS